MPRRRFELLHLTALPPQSSASTNFATWAFAGAANLSVEFTLENRNALHNRYLSGNMKSIRKKFIVTCIVAFFSLTAGAQQLLNVIEKEKIFTSENDRDRLINYFTDPRANNIDVIHYTLDLILNPDTLYIYGNTEIAFRCVKNLDTIFLDLADSMLIDSVFLNENLVSFTQPIDNSFLVFTPAIIDSGEIDSVKIYYRNKPSPHVFGSISKSTHAGKNYLYNLSEPYNARNWFPCKQSLNDKADSVDIIIHHPVNTVSASNGLLIDEDTVAGTINSHWSHRYPIASYLIGFCVGDYSFYQDTVHFDNGDSLLVWNYVFPDYLDTAKKYSKQLVPVIKYFSEIFGDYGFMKEKYGQMQWGFGGGMEHQTISSVGSMDYALITHELAHQWFGDKITCASWRDIWLNEGFATYSTGLCFEKFFPEWFDDWKSGTLNNIYTPEQASTWVWDTTWTGNIFNYRFTYEKGAYILHMLRWLVGDSAFFNGLKSYQQDQDLCYSFSKLLNFKLHMELASGTDLTEFFNQWYYGYGYPSYHLQWCQNAGNETKIYVTQSFSSLNNVAYYKMPIPVKFYGANKDTTVRFENIYNGQIFSTTLPFKIDSIVFDPELHLISFDNTIQQVPGFADASVSVFPNPSSDNLTVYFSADFIPDFISVFSIDGKEIFSSSISLEEKQTMLPITTDKLTAGVYLIKVKHGVATRTLRWIKL